MGQLYKYNYDYDYTVITQGDYNYDYKEKSMVTIMITIMDYSLAVTVYIGFLHSAANMQGVINVITCPFMHHFYINRC